MGETKVYWFPAKRRGWGWGLPAVWQGKVVLASFYLLVVAGAFAVLPKYGKWVFVIYCGGLCIVLLVVCWIKGEPPKWRWEGN